MIPPDSTERWAIASFVYVYPRLEGATEYDPTEWEGQRELMLFSGTGAAEIFKKAILCGRETEAIFIADSNNEIAKEIGGDLGPYLPTRFLGFEEIAFTAEAPSDGALLSPGHFDTQAEGINLEGVNTRDWQSASWALVEARVGSGNCWLHLVHAGSWGEAAEKARRIIQSGEVLGVTRVTSEEKVYSGCDLLCFPTAHPAAAWRRIVKPNANLAIASGLDAATLDPPYEVTLRRQEQTGLFLSAVREKWMRKP